MKKIDVRFIESDIAKFTTVPFFFSFDLTLKSMIYASILHILSEQIIGSHTCTSF